MPSEHERERVSIHAHTHSHIGGRGKSGESPSLGFCAPRSRSARPRREMPPPHVVFNAPGVFRPSSACSAPDETLDGFLAESAHPHVVENASSYAAIMRRSGFSSLEILLNYDDGELQEMHEQLQIEGIPRGHSMEIKKQIKQRKPNGGSGPPSVTRTNSAPKSEAEKDAPDSHRGQRGEINGSPRAMHAPAAPAIEEHSVEVYIAHARERIGELADILSRKQDAKATIPSDDGREPRLGKGLAINQWLVNVVPAPPYLTALSYTPHTACAAAPRRRAKASRTRSTSASSMHLTNPSTTCVTCSPTGWSSAVSARTRAP